MTVPSKTYSIPVVLLALGAYLNSLPNEFIWDDTRAIERNYLIKRLRHLPRLFVSDLYEGTGQPAGNYRPLVLTGFAIDYALFGARPWAYRSVNLILHAVASLLVFVLLSRLLRRPGEVPLIAGLLFAVHPVHAEAVAVVMGRAELMATCLVLGGWIVYLGRGRWAVPISLFLFFLSLLCKETAAIFPMLIAAGSLSRREPLRGVARDFVLGLAVFALYVPLRIHALGGFAPAQSQIILREMGLIQRVGVMIPIFREYLLLFLFPVKLSLDYQFLALPGASTQLDLLLGSALLAGLGTLAVVAWRRRSEASLAIPIFVIALLPVSHIVPFGEILGERLLYLPSVGACLALAVAFARSPRAVRWGGILIVALGCAAMTVERNRDLADRGSAALAMLRHYPISPKAQVEVGNLYLREGRIEEARRRYEAAIQLRPRYVVPQSGLGEVLLAEGRLDEAEIHFQGLREAYPDFTHAIFKLGNVRLRKGDREGAKALFEEAVARRESDPDSRLNLGVLAYLEGNREEAIRIFEKVLFFHPDHVQTLDNLAKVLAEEGRFDEAASAKRKAIRWGTPSAESYYLLGLHEYRTGPRRRRAALKAFEEALRLEPDHRGAAINRAVILLDLARYDEAEAIFRKLREKDPADAPVVFNHARALEGLSRRAEAIEAYRKFLEVYDGPDDEYREEARKRLE